MSTISLIFMAFWVVGSVSSVTLGGFLHLFLLMAIVIMLPRFIWGRKTAR